MTDKPLTKQKIKSSKTKKKIYDVSVELINRHGYDKVTVDDICKKCGISKGAFYHHFNSKLDIISHAEAMVNLQISEALLEHFDIDILEKILIVTSFMFESVEKTGLEFTRQRTKYVVGGEYINEKEKHIFSIYSREFLCDILMEAIESGQMKEDTPVSLITETVMTLICGLISEWCIYNGSFSLLDRSWKLTNFLLPEILKPYMITPLHIKAPDAKPLKK